MSEEDVSKIFDKLDGLSDRMARQETKMDNVCGSVASMIERHETIMINGCPKYHELVEMRTGVHDHEKRVGTLESDKRVIVGAATAAGAVSGGLFNWLK